MKDFIVSIENPTEEDLDKLSEVMNKWQDEVAEYAEDNNITIEEALGYKSEI